MLHDGKEGVPEVDFQQSGDLWVNWKFLDQESRILFYRFWVDKKCMEEVPYVSIFIQC